MQTVSTRPSVTVVLMGVSGAGKSTVLKVLVERLGWPSAEADDFHSAANVVKMSSGHPLTDEDRWPWLRAMRAVIEEALAGNVGTVVTCSALKRAYRDVLSGGLPNVHYVHLTGDADVLATRLAGRRGHFMNPALLDSQLATLEAPADAIDVDVALTPDQQVEFVRQALGL
jgi:gluconokinase